ncbi:MAG: hydroxymethylbilane synthase [Chthoniobacterales bacterium]|nr:hydroxymethylbilane synthase [Chthoniobacterales bacterium]
MAPAKGGARPRRSMSRDFILATRGSELALAQTRNTAARLSACWPDLAVREMVLRTTGDRRLDADLKTLGGLEKGLFTKELEEALLAGRAHAAVHSLKDLPTRLPDGLALGAILPRAATADVLVSRTPGGLDALADGARVGTGSPRRRAMLLADRPKVLPEGIRGNVPTRLRKLVAGEFDAVILAAAGLERLGYAPTGNLSFEGETLHCGALPNFLPAPGQGAVAVEIRAGDEVSGERLRPLHDTDTAEAVAAEREVLALSGGGCHAALGARATLAGSRITIEAMMFDARDGSPKYATLSGGRADAAQLAREIVRRLNES